MLDPIAIAVATDFRGKRTFKEFTPRASLSFKPDDDNMIYASYSKGFKGGGFDPRGSGTSAPISDPSAGRTYEDIYNLHAFDRSEERRVGHEWCRPHIFRRLPMI